MKPSASKQPDAVLVVDDDDASRVLLQRILERRGHRVFVAGGATEGLEIARREQPSLVLLDVVMPELDGYEVCRRLKADPLTRGSAVVFLSALKDAPDKVRGLKLGAVDYLTKPFHKEEVLARVHAHLSIQRLQGELAQRNAKLEHELWVARELMQRAREGQKGPLLGESEAVVRLREEIAAAAATEVPVLLVSQGGAGEEAVARAIHHLSARSARPFLQLAGLGLNASAALVFGPDSRWRLATEGVLYFDRVDLLSEAVLTRLSERLGGSEGGPRVVGFSRGEPPAALDSAEWMRIEVPSLCDRACDLPALAEHYLQRKARRLGRETLGLSIQSLDRLRDYPWPGNIDELSGVLDCALMASEGPRVEVSGELLKVGKRVGGYQLVRRVGSGGMGDVWLAKHRLLVRPAAVKLIRASQLADPTRRADSLARLELEARATARLESLNTVRLYDFGVTDDGSLYYVMEYLEGLDLRTLVDRYGSLSPERAVFLLAQACESLSEAHGQGLVHRDIKPANLFLTRLGDECDVLKVLDFGLVHDLLAADGEVERVVVGTPSFYSPEACRGRADRRGDLYSLGCSLHWLLTGVYVFDADSVSGMVDAHLQETPQPPSRLVEGIPPELDDLVMALLEKDPTRRPSTAAEVKERLEAIPLQRPWGQVRAKEWWDAWPGAGGPPRWLEDDLSETNVTYITDLSSDSASTRVTD